MKASVHFHNLYGTFSFKNRTKLKVFIIDLFKREHTPLEQLNYIFCSDEYLLQLNVIHLKHDTYTDIITFPLSEAHAPVISDIYISIDRVKENTQIHKTSVQQELHRVIFHGALHLCGYKDKSKADKQLMRDKEDFYLGSYFVPRETL